MILTFFFLYFEFLLFFNLSNLFLCSLICNFNASTSLDRFLYFLAVLDFLFWILFNCRFVSEELLVPLAVPLIDPLGIVFLETDFFAGFFHLNSFLMKAINSDFLNLE